MSRSHVALAVAVVVAVAGGLTGCGFSSGSDEGGGEGASGGTLRIGTPRAMALATDPAIVGNAGNMALNAEIYDQLVQKVGDRYVPELAEKWTNEGNVWTFTLRPGLKFSDGSPLTARDVKASFDRTANPELGSSAASLWTDAGRSEAPDDRTFRLNTERPLGTVLASMTQLNVAPAKQLEGIDTELQQQLGSAKVPIGSGPFMLESHASEQKAVLKANPQYWGEKPKLDRLEYRYIPELSARFTALETGELDVTWGVGPDQLGRLEGQDALTVESVPSNNVYLVWFNGKQKPFDDERVRQAMNYAVDTKRMIGDLFPGYGKVGTAPLPSNVFGYAEQRPYPYDPARAKQLLAEAGVPNGFSAEVQYVTNYAPQIDQLVSALVSYWAKIGVRVEAIPKETAAWGADLIALKYDVNAQDNPTVTGDADYTMFRLYASDAPDSDRPYNGIRDKQLDGLLDQARHSLDQGDRQRLYAQAQKLMWDKAMGYWPLEAPLVYAWRDDVEGIGLAPIDAPLFNRATKGA